MREQPTVTMRQISLHGHVVNFRHYRPRGQAADGARPDPIVLLHGIAGSSRTWRPVLRELAERDFAAEAIAIDLLGHGESATPRGDYSLGAFASAVRDVLTVLGHRRVTVAGHSLGGGVAMQFAYQFPELCGRLVLVCSGGLGPEVSPMIRAANLPGAGLALALFLNRTTIRTAGALRRAARTLPVETAELAAHVASLADPARRTAFLHTIRGSTDLRGQRASARDRLYLADLLPSLIVWGDRDRIIPVAHAHQAAALMPNSRLEIISGAGHFAHCSAPRRFTDALIDFLRGSTAARLDADDLATILRERAAPGR